MPEKKPDPIEKYPEAVWCMHCGAGSRMAFIPDPLNFHCPYCNQWNHLDHQLYFEKPFTLDQSKRISFGISQIGGKYRLLNKILLYIPYHEFYLEPFVGSGIVIANKPRCRYECANDINSALINYLLIVKYYPEYLDQEKHGVMGLVSQEICNRIVRGELVPKNNLEAGLFFYYLNKLTFGGSVQKGFTGIVDQKRQNPRIDASGIEEAKQIYDYKTKGFGGIINPRAIPQNTLHDEDFEKIKENSPYRGVVLPTVCKNKSINNAKANYRGLAGPHPLCTVGKEQYVKEAKKKYQEKVNLQSDVPKNAPYAGIHNTRALGNSINSRDMEKWKQDFQNQTKNAQHKGINPKTTRPFTNNDCGLLTPLNPNAIKRLRYVNLTCYHFKKLYKMFYRAFHKKKKLGPECFIYFDPPFPGGTEKYYDTIFEQKDHEALIKIIKDSPFHVMLSIGGECDFYLEALNNFAQIPVKVKYSTDANSQKDSQEYLIMNYDINKLPKMKFSSDQRTLLKFMEVKKEYV